MNHPKMNNPEFINYIGKIALNKPSNSDIYCAEMAEFVQTFFKIAIPSYFRYSFFIEGGSMAVENALKTAFDWKVRKNFKKGHTKELGHQVIHFKQAFHGRSGLHNVAYQYGSRKDRSISQIQLAQNYQSQK